MLRRPADLLNSVVKFSSLDTFLFDCDGVIWNGNVLIPGAKDVLHKLKSLGKKVFLITNNSSKSTSDYSSKCKTLGLNIDKSEIIGSSYVAANYLKSNNFKGKLYIVGPQALADEMDIAGIEYVDYKPGPLEMDLSGCQFEKLIKLEPDVTGVIVGFDWNFSYLKLMKAASYISRGAQFFATNTDSQLPLPGTDLVQPGTGTLVSAVSVAVGKAPIVMGKPHKPVFDVLCDIYHIDPKRTIMFGDRLETDILFGTSNGMYTALVMTGITTDKLLEGVVNGDDPNLVPHVKFNSIRDLLDNMNS